MYVFLAEWTDRRAIGLSTLIEQLGPPPGRLPTERRLRKLIDEATRGPRWRAVGSTRDRFRVREDLADDEGRLLLAFYRDVAEGKEPVPPRVSPRARWWWPDELSGEDPEAPADDVAPTRLPATPDNWLAANDGSAPAPSATGRGP